MRKTPWTGWKLERPSLKQRVKMREKCGRKCFLGSKTSFPICIKNTCTISRKGIYAAYIRARQFKYYKISRKAKNMINKVS
jgi:hypothetical protein